MVCGCGVCRACTGIIIAYIFIFRVGSMLSVRLISYQRR